MNRQINRFGGAGLNRLAAAKYQAQAQAASPSALAGWLGLGDLQGSQSQPYGSHSGGGGYGGSPGGSCFSIDICPDLILAAIAAAAAAAAFFLYITITAAGRRRKRSDGSKEASVLDSLVQLWVPQHVGLSDLFHLGRKQHTLLHALLITSVTVQCTVFL